MCISSPADNGTKSRAEIDMILFFEGMESIIYPCMTVSYSWVLSVSGDFACSSPTSEYHDFEDPKPVCVFSRME